MARYIDGDKLCRVIAGHSYYSGDRILSRIRCLQEGKITNKSIKPDDVIPIVHAHWIVKDEMIKSPFARNYKCSHCEYEPLEQTKYCGNCGAKMDEVETI